MSLAPEQREIAAALNTYSKERSFPIHYKGDQISTLLVGEKHWKYVSEQAALARYIRPQKILLEGLGGFMYDPKREEIESQEGRRCHSEEINMITQRLETSITAHFTGLREYLDVSNELQIPLLGCDISNYEMWEKAVIDYGETPDSIKELLSDTAKFLETTDRRTRAFRDKFMADYIAKNQGTPYGPTIARIGWHHAKYLYDTSLLDNYCFLEQISPTDNSPQSKQVLQKLHINVVIRNFVDRLIRCHLGTN